MTINLNHIDNSILIGTNERLRITSDGKISTGGLASPDGNLHVYNSSAGSVTAATDANELVLESTANVGMSFLTANDALSRIKFGDPDATNAGIIIYSHADDSLRFQHTTNERFRITSAGRVGINETSPSAQLDVRTDEDPTSGLVGFIRNNASGGNGVFYGMDLNGVGNWSLGMPDNTDAFTIVDGEGNSGSEKLRIDSSGNTHFGSSGTLNDSNTVSIIPSDGRISFGMDGRTSYVTGESACYIYSGEGSSGTTLAGELILQSRSNLNRNITFVTGATPTAQMIVYGSGGVFAHTKNNFLLNEFKRGDTSSQFGALSTSWSTDTTINDTISNYQRGQRIIIRATVPCGIALNTGSGTNYGGTNVRVKVTGNTSGGATYSNNRAVWYRADGAGTHETTINLFICVYINESDTTFSNGETLTVTIEGQRNSGGVGGGTHYLGGWSTTKEITIERYIKEL